MRRPTNLRKFFALLLIYVFSVTVAAAESAQVRIPGPGGALTGGGSLTAATPTFSPGSGTYSSTQSVTISTATSGCGSYIYWSTVHNPPTTGDNHGTAVTVSSSETVYAKVIGCPGYLDSSVGDAIYTIGGSANACPTGANYLNSATNTLVTLASLGITKCYYISAAGSDSGPGSTEATPWLHAPFMPNCSVNCLTVQSSMSGTAAAGWGFIFRGGDTWHFGNSAASPYTGGTWEFFTGGKPVGTSSHPIYLGFDQNWYSGASWARPKLYGDNPPCGAGTVGGNCVSLAVSNTSIQAYYVNSCPYQTGGVTGANLMDLSALAYYIVDNFDMSGVCTKTVGHPYASNIYIEYNEVTGPIQFLNIYMHGWSHLQFVAGQGSASCTSTVVCFNSFGFQGMGNNSTTISDILRYNVVDGSDSDYFGLESAYAGFYDSAFDVFRYNAGSIFRNMHLYHDNLYEYTVENGHSNIVENYAEWANGDNVLYNSVFRDIDFEGPGQGNLGNTPVLWLWPNYPSGVDFIFGNVLSSNGSVQLINVGRNLQNVGTYSFFGNTIDFRIDELFSRRPRSLSVYCAGRKQSLHLGYGLHLR